MEGITQPEISIGAQISQQAEKSRHFGIKGLMAVYASTLAIAGGVESMPTPVTPLASAEAVSCTPNDYNTIICGKSKAAAEKYCTDAVSVDNPEGLMGTYVDGSKRKYKVSFKIPEISGCAPAGNRKISVFQELRKGSDGTFKKNSNTASHKSTDEYKMNTTLTAPYNCAKNMAGSAVRTIVKLTWIPKKGWPGKPSSTTFGEDNQKGTPIC